MNTISELAESRYVAAVSHELRGPLHAVLGLAELLLHEDLQPRQRELVGSIQREADSMRHIVDDLLDLARLSSGRFALQPQSFSPVIEVSAVVSSFQAQAAEKDVGLLLDAAPDVPRHVVADGLRFTQVVRNLVSNAIRYSDEGSVGVHLSVDELDRIVVTVQDSGIGIAAEMFERIFEPFVRAHEARAGGTGLGLAVCRRLATVLGGELTVTSTVGVGSEFRFVCPIEASTAIPEAGSAPRAATRSGHVLVVEDSPVNQLVATGQLRLLGIDSTFVASAEDAFELLEHRDVDAILMDWNLPGMNGLEATEHIREVGLVAPAVPIIAMTANALVGDRERCLAAGMSDFMAKPLGLDELRQTLDRWMDPIETTPTALDAEISEALGRLEEQLDDPIATVVVVQTYLNELEDRRSAIVTDTDSETVFRAAHTLRSTSALLGAERLAALCAELEASERVDPELTGRIDDEIDRVRRRFGDFLQTRDQEAA